MATRLPILRWVDQATNKTVNPGQYALMVDYTGDDTQGVQLPAAARALRLHGILQQGQTAVVNLAVGDKISIQKTGRAYTNLATGKACLPGDLVIVSNNAGDSEAYVPGTGTVQYAGFYRTKYTNAQPNSVPVEYDQFPGYIYQVERVDGFIRTPTANNTRSAGRDATEINGDEYLFVAPWNGTLQGPLRMDVLTGGAPGGNINVQVRIKVPGVAWATAQVGNPAANWQTGNLNLGALAVNAEGSIDDTTVALPWGNSLAITKGTKVGFSFIKDAAFAQVTQVAASLRFF